MTSDNQSKIKTAAVPLSEQDLDDILDGATILAAGGGGPYTLGRKLVKSINDLGVRPMLIAPEHVEPDARMAISAGVGSPDVASDVANFGVVATDAYQALATKLGTTFSYVMPGEVGAGNSFVPIFVAAKLGVPVVDVSGAPRAMPLFDMTSFEGHVSVSPVMVSDGSTEVFFEGSKDGTPNSQVADRTARAVVSSGNFGDLAGVGMFSMTGSEMQEYGMHRTLSSARALGATLREAKAAGNDPVAAVADHLGGKVLYWADDITEISQSGGGFDTGIVELSSKSTSVTVTLIAQNENILGWRSDQSQPLGLGPDLLCYLTEDGQPFSNAAEDVATFAKGKRVALIGVPASTLNYRTPEIVAAWMGCMRNLGYAGVYTPIEELPAWLEADNIDLRDQQPSDG